MMRRRKADRILAHYASQYYDPVKAHEYYMQNRQLKGNQPAEKLSKESRQRQAEAQSYVRNQIGTARKADQTQAADNYKNQTEQLRATADAARQAIVDELKAFVRDLKNKTAPQLLPIPRDASPKLRAFLESQNARRASEAASKQNEVVSGKLKQLTDDLHNALEKARTDYVASRKASSEKFKQDLVTEQKNIRDQVR